jgi:hypothetical protein
MLDILSGCELTVYKLVKIRNWLVVRNTREWQIRGSEQEASSLIEKRLRKNEN